MTPMNLHELFSHNNWIFLLIGIAFGFALEVSGFGDSRRLAAQFYFYEMRVLKVMFTAIITAMLLIFFATSLGLLDFSKVYVNPTFLWPGIVGGLVMGVGFIIGGFCPGTSLVGASTLKGDAIVFVLGVFFGVFMFGESAPHIDDFYNASSMGRFTLFDLFNVDAGIVVLIIFIFAIGAFALAEWGEKKMASLALEKPKANPNTVFWFAGIGLILALVALIKGQPSAEQKWTWLAPKLETSLAAREFHIHPMELRDLMTNPDLSLQILDLREEADFNLFHLENAKRISEKDLFSNAFIKKMLSAPPNRIVVLVGQGDMLSTQIWKKLKGADIINLYILDGGINHWLSVFPLDSNIAMLKPTGSLTKDTDETAFEFFKSVGGSQFSSYPFDPVHLHKNLVMKYDKKVKIQTKTAVKGGCG